jgi:YD repeat-containing protein
MRLIRRLSISFALLTSIALASPLISFAQVPITFQYFYDDTGQLVKVVDSTGVVIEYVYDPVGNILEVKRSTLSNPNGLQLFNFTPAQGGPGTLVTIQGQGFSTIPSGNTVRFGAVVAPVVSAATNMLIVTVPVGATSGPVSVTVDADTATSTNSFTVLALPQITSLSLKALVRGATVSPLVVTGVDLTGATFSFLPAFNPEALSVTAASVNADGTAATLTITLGPNAAGTFVLIATKAAGSSDPFPTEGNSLRILDPAQDEDHDGLSNGDEITHGTDPFNPDTDGDGFPDGAEVDAGSDPLDPASTPLTLLGSIFTEAVAATVSILNTSDPSTGPNPDPTVAVREATGVTVSVLNLADPSTGSTPDPTVAVTEAIGPTVSLLNTGDPSQGSAPDPNVAFTEVVGPTVSLLNTGDPSQGGAPDPKVALTETVGPTVSLLNRGDPSQGGVPDPSVFFGEAVAPTVSFLNTNGGPLVLRLVWPTTSNWFLPLARPPNQRRSRLWLRRWPPALTLFNEKPIFEGNSRGVIR